MTDRDREFKDAYELYSREIYNFSRKMTGNPMVAEDITHDTFLQAYINRDSFRGESSLRTWLYSIARNNCFLYFRKTKKTRFEDIEDLIDKTADPQSCSVYSEMEKRVYISQVKEGCLLGLIRCLPGRQRTAFILYVFNDFSAGETARILGISPNAVRILIHRARSGLKSFLCRNCSLYNKSNPCRCENLISFSLKQGWINQERDPGEALKTLSELREFRDEIALYRSLGNSPVPENLTARVSEFISSSDFGIFSEKK